MRGKEKVGIGSSNVVGIINIHVYTMYTCTCIYMDDGGGGEGGKNSMMKCYSVWLAKVHSLFYTCIMKITSSVLVAVKNARTWKIMCTAH